MGHQRGPRGAPSRPGQGPGQGGRAAGHPGGPDAHRRGEVAAHELCALDRPLPHRAAGTGGAAMTLPNNRRRDPGGASSEAILVWLAIVLVVVVVGGVYAAMHLGHRLASTGADLPGDPFTVLFGLLGGDLAWPGAAGWWVIAAGAALLVFSAIATGLVIHRIRGGRSRVDRAARYMGRGRDVQDLTRKHAQGTATRLGVSSSPGVPIGRTVARDEPLYGSW